jgi:hypothetical protein
MDVMGHYFIIEAEKRGLQARSCTIGRLVSAGRCDGADFFRERCRRRGSW